MKQDIENSLSLSFPCLTRESSGIVSALSYSGLIRESSLTTTYDIGIPYCHSRTPPENPEQ